ncbi:MAG: NYN domain-containing protein [Bacteroidetes bacterium]|nr:NYN domain-containing protein [Bacteroidota bacterium]
MAKKTARNERVIAYIDGFNLYFGMCENNQDTKWLDLRKLVENMLLPNQKLVKVKYFTSNVSNNPAKQKRQQSYLSALRNSDVEIIYGKYNSHKTECFRCYHTWSSPEEKMTDVNIAVGLIIDAMDNLYDTAMLISGDSDLVPPIKAVHAKFSPKRVLVAFPPNRFNISVKNVAKGSFIIGRKKLKDSLFPEKMKLSSGYLLQKPKDW